MVTPEETHSSYGVSKAEFDSLVGEDKLEEETPPDAAKPKNAKKPNRFLRWAIGAGVVAVLAIAVTIGITHHKERQVANKPAKAYVVDDEMSQLRVRVSQLENDLNRTTYELGQAKADLGKLQRQAGIDAERRSMEENAPLLNPGPRAADPAPSAPPRAPDTSADMDAKGFTRIGNSNLDVALALGDGTEYLVRNDGTIVVIYYVDVIWAQEHLGMKQVEPVDNGEDEGTNENREGVPPADLEPSSVNDPPIAPENPLLNRATSQYFDEAAYVKKVNGGGLLARAIMCNMKAKTA